MLQIDAIDNVSKASAVNWFVHVLRRNTQHFKDALDFEADEDKN